MSMDLGSFHGIYPKSGGRRAFTFVHTTQPQCRWILGLSMGFIPRVVADVRSHLSTQHSRNVDGSWVFPWDLSQEWWQTCVHICPHNTAAMSMNLGSFHGIYPKSGGRRAFTLRQQQITCQDQHWVSHQYLCLAEKCHHI